MAKQNPSKPPKKPKVSIFTRFSPETITAIDALCAEDPRQPTRARIIEAAVLEYLEKHSTCKKGR